MKRKQNAKKINDRHNLTERIYLNMICLSILLFCALLINTKVATAERKTAGVWKYEITGKKTVAITGYTGASKAVKVPSKIRKRKVTSLGYGHWTNAPFNGNRYIEKVFIPSTVTKIERSCFENCDTVKQITGCKGVVSIEKWAFSKCKNLRKIEFGNKLQSIGYEAFSYCENLLLGKFPNSLKGIETGSFYNCDKITSITLPANLKRLGPEYQEGAGCVFAECDSLKTVVLNKKIEFIAWENFKGCFSLENVTIPSGITAICAGAFESCTSLGTISIPKTVEFIGESAFENCTGLKDVNLKYGLFYIGYWCFQGCSNLKTLKIPNSVTTIDNYALNNCGFSSITVPNSVTTIKCTLSDATIYCYENSYAHIWAVEKGKKYVLLEARPCKKIIVENKKIMLKIGQVSQINYILNPTDTSDAVIWESSADEIVSVNGSGKITAKSKGTAVVIAKTTSGKSARITIIVK